MKKFLLLTFALLLSISGAWAKTALEYTALTTGVDYVLADNGQSWFLSNAGKTGVVNTANKYRLVATDTDGQYYLMQVSTGQYIAKATGSNANATWTSEQANAEKFTIGMRDNSTQVRFCSTTQSGDFFNSASTSSNACPKWYNGPGDWSYWYVYTYEDAYADFVATLPQLTTDVNAPKYYSIKAYSRGGFLTSQGAGAVMKHVDFTDGSIWYFTAAEGNTSGNVTGGVIAHSYDGTQMTTSWTTAATGETVYLLANNVNSNGLSICKSASISDNSCCDAQNNNVGNWAPAPNDWEGTTWVIEPTILNGYYYFKGMETSRYPYLYSDFVGKGETDTYHHSLPESPSNGNIWKVTNNGSTLSAVNGEGLPVVIGETSYSSLTVGSVAEGLNYYFTEAINLTNWGNGTKLTTWTAGGSGATDNRWTFESADVSAGVYSVVITGNDDAYVTYSGQNAKNGGFFVAASIAEADLTTQDIEGYSKTVSIVDNTITVAYEFEAVLSYTLTDANGATYTGTYPGVAGTTVPTFTGCDGYTLTDASWDENTYSATINFPFAVSSNGVTNQTFIGQFQNKNNYAAVDFLWHASGTSVIVHSGDFPGVTEAEQSNYLWVIEPAISDLGISFTIKNAATGTYINSTASKNGHEGTVTLGETATPVTYNSTSTTTTCSPINAFYLPSTTMYLSVNSVGGGTDAQLGVYNIVHDGISVGFPTAAAISRYWTKNEIESKLAYAGQCGYPATTNSDYGYLVYVKGALARGIYEGTGKNYTDLVTWYNGYLATSDIVKPTVGKFYTVYQPTAGRYIYGTMTSDNVLANGTDGTSAAAIFYVPASGRFLSYKSGYAMTSNTLATSTYANGGYSTYTINHYSGHTFGTVRLYNTKYLYTISSIDYVDLSAYGSESSKNWEIAEVASLPVTISSAEWATFSAPVALEIPEGVKAYTATAGADKLTLTEIEGVIPANTGVLLNATAGTYNFNITTTDATVEDNVFEATTAAIAVTANENYVLANGKNGLGFYLLNGAKMPGFKAYIPKSSVPDASESAFFSILLSDDDLTAISEVEAEVANGQYYDLQGRKVAAPQKGQIYIVNGKKVLY